MTNDPVLLEVGRVGRAHGLRGEVHVVAVSNVAERFAPGSTLFVGDRPLVIASVAAAPAAAGSCSSPASTTATRAEALRGKIVRGRARSPTRPTGELWVHELIGAEVRDRAGARIGRVDRGAGESRARPARARRRRARPDGVRRRPRAGRRRRRPARRPASISDGRVRIDVFTIFPEYLDGPLARVAASAARATPGLLDVRVHDPRAFTTDVHRSVDDAPFGGGAGMVMMPEPLFAAVEAVQPPRPLLLLSASGPRFDQARGARARRPAPASRCSAAATRASTSASPTTCCDGELSVGDYVLAGRRGAPRSS